VSGNPGRRPKGLARYVRELVGDDGRRIADFMLGVLDYEAERTETRMRAANWLADRGFGRAAISVADEEAPTTIVVKSAFADDTDSLAGVSGREIRRAAATVPLMSQCKTWHHDSKALALAGAFRLSHAWQPAGTSTVRRRCCPTVPLPRRLPSPRRHPLFGDFAPPGTLRPAPREDRAFLLALQEGAVSLAVTRAPLAT
jgi:hypothetical protein